MDQGTTDLGVLDGEDTQCGGIRLAKQLKNELLQCLPVVLIGARRDDGWLAEWSKAI